MNNEAFLVWCKAEDIDINDIYKEYCLFDMGEEAMKRYDLSKSVNAIEEYPDCGDYILFTDHEEEVKRAVAAEREATKRTAIEFFWWWYNRPGSNIGQGYDTFISQRLSQ